MSPSWGPLLHVKLHLRHSLPTFPVYTVNYQIKAKKKLLEILLKLYLAEVHVDVFTGLLV